MLGFPEKPPLSVDEVIKDLSKEGQLNRAALARFSKEKKKPYIFIVAFGLFLTAIGSFDSGKTHWAMDLLFYGAIWSIIGIVLYYLKRRSDLYVFMHSYGTEVPACIYTARRGRKRGFDGWVVKYKYEDLNQQERSKKIKFQLALHPNHMPVGEHDSDGTVYTVLLHPKITTDVFKLKVEADIYNLRSMAK